MTTRITLDRLSTMLSTTLLPTFSMYTHRNGSNAYWIEKEILLKTDWPDGLEWNATEGRWARGPLQEQPDVRSKSWSSAWKGAQRKNCAAWLTSSVPQGRLQSEGPRLGCSCTGIKHTCKDEWQGRRNWSESVSTDTYPTDPQIEGLLLRLRLEETGTDGGTGRLEGMAACAGGAGTGTDGILNGEALLIGVWTLPLLKLLTLLLQKSKMNQKTELVLRWLKTEGVGSGKIGGFPSGWGGNCPGA